MKASLKEPWHESEDIYCNDETYQEGTQDSGRFKTTIRVTLDNLGYPGFVLGFHVLQGQGPVKKCVKFSFFFEPKSAF